MLNQIAIGAPRISTPSKPALVAFVAALAKSSTTRRTPSVSRARGALVCTKPGLPSSSKAKAMLFASRAGFPVELTGALPPGCKEV